MVVEMRSYLLHPGALPGFMKLMEAEGIAIERPILGNLLGYYTSEIGDLNKVIHLWGYDSFEERQRRRLLLAGDARWAAFVPKVLPLIRDMRNELLQPASFSPC